MARLEGCRRGAGSCLARVSVVEVPQRTWIEGVEWIVGAFDVAIAFEMTGKVIPSDIGG